MMELVDKSETSVNLCETTRRIIPQDSRRNNIILVIKFFSMLYISLPDNFSPERVQVISTASVEVTAFWYKSARNLVEVDRRFKDACCVHEGDECC
jgi:hypothetical protein